MTQAVDGLAGHSQLPPAVGGLATGAGRRTLPQLIRSLFLLTKPRIIELLLVTTLPTMMLADRGLPSAWLIGVTLVGGALAAGSANTLNCYLDRDIDAVMKRTSRRPLVARTAGQAAMKPGRRWPPASCSVLAVDPAARAACELAVGGARRRGDLVLRVRLHAAAQAPDRVQHRDRRRGGLLPRTGRLGRRHRHRELAGGGPVRDHLPLDAAALLGAGDEVQRRLRRREGADAAGRRVRRHGRAQDPAVLLRRWWPRRCCWPRTQAGLTVPAPPGSAAGSWLEAHRLRARIAAGGKPPAPMRLFHLSIAYLTLLFAVVAVTALLPRGRLR